MYTECRDIQAIFPFAPIKSFAACSKLNKTHNSIASQELAEQSEARFLFLFRCTQLFYNNFKSVTYRTYCVRFIVLPYSVKSIRILTETNTNFLQRMPLWRNHKHKLCYCVTKMQQFFHNFIRKLVNFFSKL